MKGTTLYFDLETGGVEDYHPNIQIAAVAVRDWKEVGEFERKIQFDVNKCDPAALRLNGYTPAAWEDAVTEGDAMRAFDAFCLKHGDLRLVSARTGRPYTMARLAGHNVVSFDVPRVRAAMERAGVKFWKGCWWYPLDTYQRTLWHYEESGLEGPDDYKLQTIARFLDIPPQGPAHDALADVRLCVKIARSLSPPVPA